MARRETHTGDIPVRQFDAVDDLSGDAFDRANVIEPVERMPQTDHLDELVFMAEPVTIRLERTSAKFAPQVLDFSVNGIAKWVRVGQSTTLPRSYVEVIARSQPMNVQTEVVEDGGPNGMPVNRLLRDQSTAHPFTVVKDTDKGHAWLQRIVREA
jgi:hypothetical protein